MPQSKRSCDEERGDRNLMSSSGKTCFEDYGVALRLEGGWKTGVQVCDKTGSQEKKFGEHLGRDEPPKYHTENRI